MNRSPERPRNRTGRPEQAPRRLGLAPALLAAVVLLVGVALLGTEAFLVIRFVVAVLALIIAWFAVRARHWWWLPPLAAIAVLWNPVVPLELPGDWWLGAQYLAIIVVVAAGVLIRVPADAVEATRPAR